MFAQNLFRSALARRLGLSLGLCVLAGTLALAFWMRAWNRHQSLADMRDLAVGNAAFIDKMRLPASPLLAQRLSEVLDMGVGFRFAGEREPEWPDGLGPAIESLTSRDMPAVMPSSGHELAAAPLKAGEAVLILIRPQPGVTFGFNGMVLAPAIGLALLFGGVGLVLAHDVVRPVASLTAWLPNLNLAPGDDPDSIPRAIRTRRDELGELGRAIEASAHRLRREQERRRQSERLATLGRIATSLAHEIKNPAAAIGLHADVLRHSLSSECQEPVRLIREEVNRITGLINQWMFVARAKPGTTQPHDLRSLVANLIPSLRPVLEHAHARIDFSDDGSLPVEIDALRIEQAIRNLVTNAVQAMPEGGRIRIGLSRNEGCARLEISDEGSGFSDEALRRFGEPFFSEREGGMGIGLTLATEVFAAHGGTLRPENLPSGGAMVRAELPLRNSKPKAVAR